MVLDKLNAGGEVGLVELVRDVPSQWTELTALLMGPNRTISTSHWLVSCEDHSQWVGSECDLRHHALVLPVQRCAGRPRRRAEASTEAG